MLQHFIYHLAFVYNLQKEVNYKIAEVVIKESNNNNNNNNNVLLAQISLTMPQSIQFRLFLLAK